MTDSLESSDPPPEEQPVSIVDLTEFLDYLRDNIRLNLGPKTVPSAVNSALEDTSSLECIKKFLSDTQVSSLLIQKISIKGK